MPPSPALSDEKIHPFLNADLERRWVYKTASSNVNYIYSKLPEVRKKEWLSIVRHANDNPKWKPSGIKYGHCGSVQMKDNTPQSMESAIIYLRYHQGVPKSRIQFVCEEAGAPLYFNMAKIMDAYIDKECNGDPHRSPVKSFKVFSEDRQVGRSDSAVIYLTASLDDPRVQKFVEYLDRAIGSKLVSVPVIGTSSLGRSYLQGATIPDPILETKVTGYSSSGSNGKQIVAILSRAYIQAHEDMLNDKIQPNDIDVALLNQRAQYYAKEMWNELGL